MDLAKKLSEYRLSQDEYQLICGKLGRPPEGLEWALFSALWSEHCSYKSSKIYLRHLFSRNHRVLDIQGENAGVVDLGEGERIAFKMESHNHPSFIEPLQGAATGVGGILRDIFTMGARPICNANYLCFGELSAPRMKSLVKGVVKGIGSYGNCVGVPTITGQTNFDSGYNGNILVNAMAVGLFSPGEKVFLSKASGVGNLVVYVGAKTGRDGIHGASMASESFTDDSEAKRPNVQIGDPFYEKLLIEACLEVMSEDLIVAIQDMGAAGLTSSSFEMAAKGEVGLRLHLDQVPVRDQLMDAESILLSESQERMLLICEPHQLPKIHEIFARWSLEAVQIGEVISGQEVELFWRGECLTRISPKHLVDEAPQYKRPVADRQLPTREAQVGVFDLNDQIGQLTSESNFYGKRWIYQQYDQRVGGKTVKGAEFPIGILRLPHSGRGLGVVVGCRPYLMREGVRLGSQDAVYLPALKLACYGFLPIAATDCLNFGNPEKPETMRDFKAACESLSQACEMLNAPIISGNVSLYNETNGVNVPPTPAVGLVGLRESGVAQIPSDTFLESGQEVYLIEMKSSLKASGLLGKGFLNPGQELQLVDAEVKDFIDEVRTLSLGHVFTAIQAVSDCGVIKTLTKMGAAKRLAVDLICPLDGNEVFYAVVATGSLKNLSMSSARVTLLGQTVALADDNEMLDLVDIYQNRLMESLQ